VNREIGGRSDVVGLFPNDASVIRLAGVLLIEQNDEWLIAHRYLSAESINQLDAEQEQPQADENTADDVVNLNAA
jgi:putative transposase